jgi:hypothetical protein
MGEVKHRCGFEKRWGGSCKSIVKNAGDRCHSHSPEELARVQRLADAEIANVLEPRLSQLQRQCQEAALDEARAEAAKRNAEKELVDLRRAITGMSALKDAVGGNPFELAAAHMDRASRLLSQPVVADADRLLAEAQLSMAKEIRLTVRAEKAFAKAAETAIKTVEEQRMRRFLE